MCWCTQDINSTQCSSYVFAQDIKVSFAQRSLSTYLLVLLCFTIVRKYELLCIWEGLLGIHFQTRTHTYHVSSFHRWFMYNNTYANCKCEIVFEIPPRTVSGLCFPTPSQPWLAFIQDELLWNTTQDLTTQVLNCVKRCWEHYESIVHVFCIHKPILHRQGQTITA